MNRMKQAEDRRAKVLDISEEKLDAMAAVDIRTVDIPAPFLIFVYHF